MVCRDFSPKGDELISESVEALPVISGLCCAVCNGDNGPLQQIDIQFVDGLKVCRVAGQLARALFPHYLDKPQTNQTKSQVRERCDQLRDVQDMPPLVARLSGLVGSQQYTANLLARLRLLVLHKHAPMEMGGKNDRSALSAKCKRIA